MPSVLFPSMRLMLAAMLCCCFITLSISSSNLAVALICMTSCPHHGYGGDLKWKTEQEGLVLAAQNAGSLLTLVTGMWADRLNGKWMVFVALLLCCVGNLVLPLFAADSFWFAVAARIAIGASDACLMPACNSLITRWFPQSERAAAIGLISGGRQIGTLFILPTAGYLCTRKDILDGWPAIFYLSACISILVTVFWIPFGADKPAKQCCISGRERNFIESRQVIVAIVIVAVYIFISYQPEGFRIACESIGKRTDRSRRVPYQAMLRSRALWASMFALVCHEYPLVIMLQFLPNYMRDVLEFAPTKNGLIAALPILCLFVSKTVSSSFSSYLVTKRNMDKTVVCKAFNAIASGGLAMCIFIVPLFDKTRAVYAVVSLCGAMIFAGMHTPGVITALVQLAPPFSGIITGWSFFAVAWFSIGNKILTKHIVQQGMSIICRAASEWSMVFRVSALVAALPVFVFTWWGSADRQLSRETSQSSLSTRDGMSVKKKLSTTSMSRPNSLAKNLNEAKS
ncbi:transporter, major facilitator family protein [Ancylostoma ceylanicum]|uniref:Transporter, major facilitator family protein n=1 Tax=Ancylostoma ceylanicum TaxID=53326 RepID=A0A0D6M3X6_9BILA|nr:transporter, major facilitator family protein [Ancylostoma ceylanicum]